MTAAQRVRRAAASRDMTPRRVGLVLAVVLLCAGLPTALDVRPSASGADTFAIAIAVLSGATAVVTLVLVIPAWRGRRAAAIAVATLQFVAILPALPAFVLPADLVPAGGVLLAALGVLLNLVAVILVVLDASAALLWTAALVAILAVYAMIVALAGLLVPPDADRSAQTAAAIVAALLLAPLAVALQRLTSWLVYGTRQHPGFTALRIDRRAALGEDTVTKAVEETAVALRLPGLELWEGQERLAAAGAGGERIATVELHGGLAFAVTLRPGERRLHADDRAALQLAALPLSRLLREARLLAELRTARAEAIHAREHERMVLHRELHDGLGPLLTGAALHLDAARNLPNPEAAASLNEARADVRTAIAEVRRVVYGLRPLELENSDLWNTLERRASRSGIGLSLPDPCPALPAATELAAYRIIREALANAERHAPGAPAAVTIREAEGILHIEVRNGLTPDATRVSPQPAGIGTGSMRARAEELGGRADIRADGCAWIVDVTLPST